MVASTAVRAPESLAATHGPGQAVRPPSIETTLPTMNRASSDAMYATSEAISSGCACGMREPRGILVWSAPGGKVKFANNGVTMPPGATALTRTPRPEYSDASDRVSRMTPPFEAA